MPEPVYAAGVYVGGYISGSNINSQYACYWHNGRLVALDDPNPAASHRSAVENIRIVGDDLYALGWESGPHIPNGNRRIVLWKNKERSYITSGQYEAWTNDLFISGPDIYICGTEDNGSDMIATVWKNGVAQRLSGSESEATGVTVSGNDVYVLYNDHAFTNSWRYAKNGVNTSLPVTDPATAYFYSLRVHNNTVYVVGREQTAPGLYKARLFKDGLGTVLSTIATAGSEQAFDISFRNNDVFVSGSVVSNVQPRACYWKNGELRIIGSQANSITSSAIAIATSQTDVYTAGYQYVNGWPVAAYWKNDMVTLLATDLQTSAAKCIAVK